MFLKIQAEKFTVLLIEFLTGTKFTFITLALQNENGNFHYFLTSIFPFKLQRVQLHVQRCI